MHYHASQALEAVSLVGIRALVGWFCVGHVVSRRATCCPCVSCGAVLGAVKRWEGSCRRRGMLGTRGTRLWKQLPACIVCMLSEAPAQSVEASVGEEERIRARIEVIGQDNYSSRTGQRRKELCQIRWYIDQEQETVGIGTVSRWGR